MDHARARSHPWDGSSRRQQLVALPRDEQGVIDSLSRAYRVEQLPDDMRGLLSRMR